MSSEFRGKVVLITGATKGIGLGVGLAFGRRGANCTLTHKWGSTDEDEIRRQFAAVGAPEPTILEADAGNAEDTAELLQTIQQQHQRLDVFVSNVAFAHVVTKLQDYQKRALLRSIEYSSWPTFAYLLKMKDVFGQYPRHVVTLSSIGPDAFTANYDFVAASKAVLETLCRYASHRLRPAGVRINVVRAGLVRTESLEATMGEECAPFVERFDPAMFVTVEEVAEAVVALCSGLLDSVSGQVLTVDHGVAFYDNIMRLYGERERLKLALKERET